MTPTEPLVLACTDGSELSIDALRTGLSVLMSDTAPVVVTVVAPVDWGAIRGTGHAGGLTEDGGFDRATEKLRVDAEAVLDRTVERLATPDSERLLVWGDPGPELCRLADERAATVIVIGTRGNGGLRRALLGSVSDYVVRNAPCPVLVASPQIESSATS